MLRIYLKAVAQIASVIIIDNSDYRDSVKQRIFVCEFEECTIHTLEGNPIEVFIG